MTTRACSTELDAGRSTVLLLVRHGQSEWNLDGRIQGQSPHAGGLTPAGRAQAERTAEALSERVPAPDGIVSSDLARARETAEIIAARLALPVCFDSALREQNLGELEGARFALPLGDSTGQGVVDALWRDPFRRPPSGESIADLYHRVCVALHRHAQEHPGASLVVVTHGGAVRMAIAEREPSRGSPMSRPPVDNASLTVWRPSCPAW
jgi:probable phosphoglycerate mutase